MSRGRLAGGRLISATVAVVPKATEVSGWRASGIGSTGFAQRFDENGFCQVRAESNAGVADLANQAGMPADETDALFLAHPHFAEAIQHVRLHGELLDANRGTGFHAGKRTHFRLGATCVGSGFG